MSEQRQKIYSTEFKESSVKPAIESTQPIAHKGISNIYVRMWHKAIAQ